MKTSTFNLYALTFSCLGLTGCIAPVALVGGGAVIDMASQERGVSGSFRDIKIKSDLTEAWRDTDADMAFRLKTLVREGRVLVVGNLRYENQAQDAISIAWKIPGVETVINEIKIVPHPQDTLGIDDSWIETKLAAQMLADHDVRSVNYSLIVSDGVAFILGKAQNQDELDRVIWIAKNVRGVTKIVPYVDFVSRSPEEQSTSPSAAPINDSSGPEGFTSALDSSPEPDPWTTPSSLSPQGTEIPLPPL